MQRSVPIQPKTSNNLPKFCRLAVVSPTTREALCVVLARLSFCGCRARVGSTTRRRATGGSARRETLPTSRLAIPNCALRYIFEIAACRYEKNTHFFETCTRRGAYPCFPSSIFVFSRFLSRSHPLSSGADVTFCIASHRRRRPAPWLHGGRSCGFRGGYSGQTEYLP